MHTNTTPLLVKAYKEYLRKALMSQSLDDSQSVVQQAQTTILINGHTSWRSPHINPKRAFAKLKALLVEADLAALLSNSKAAANHSFLLRGRQPATTSPADHPEGLSQELQTLFGQNGAVRSVLLYALATSSKVFMERLNTTVVHGAEKLEQALSRNPGQPLITVCNHISAADDPLVLSTLLPTQTFSDPEKLRWTLCASDRCFRAAPLIPFFRAAKVLPVQRGAGMHQPGLQAAEERLRRGDWVHIFPEGTRSKDGSLGPVRKGVGRLIAACDTPPLVVPFVHRGMEGIMPRGTMVPKVGKQVEVVVGDPIEVKDLLEAAASEGWGEDVLYRALAGRVALHMRVLRARLDGQQLDLADLSDLQGMVSGLDLYDEIDRRRSWWERCKFRMEEAVSLGHGVADVVLEGVARRVEGGAARFGSGLGDMVLEGGGVGEDGGWIEGMVRRVEGGVKERVQRVEGRLEGWGIGRGSMREYWERCSREVYELVQPQPQGGVALR